MTLIKDAERAIERLARPAIEGWGLYPQQLLALGGELVETDLYRGCQSETCAHYSHSPLAPVRRWIPPDDLRLISLGYADEPDREIEYCALLHEESAPIFVRVERPTAYHADAWLVGESEVPAGLLARLADADRAGDAR
jgi:hypothetical protein